jgi:23S rRNA (pseudouridine1915-N3)-methyltransferase
LGRLCDLPNLRNICKISMSLKLTLNFFGGRSPSWIEEGCDVYLKRLSGSMEISVNEQGSAKVVGSAGISNASKAVKNFLKGTTKSDWVVVFDEGGQAVSSTDLALRLTAWRSFGKKIRLVVGESDGLNESVLERANEVISLSRLTFPHHIARLLVLEAIYRAESIRIGHPYHRS